MHRTEAVRPYLAGEPQQQVDDDVDVRALERLGGVGLEAGGAGLRAGPARVERLARLAAALVYRGALHRAARRGRHLRRASSS